MFIAVVDQVGPAHASWKIPVMDASLHGGRPGKGDALLLPVAADWLPGFLPGIITGEQLGNISTIEPHYAYQSIARSQDSSLEAKQTTSQA